MFFSRKYRYLSTLSADTIRDRLMGQHMKVHKLDFEVQEKDRMLRIIPHAEQVEAIKTLPITHVEFNGKGEKTQVVISSHMRRIDQGGPMLIVIFCAFLLIAGLLGVLAGAEDYSIYTIPLLALGVVIFLILWFRLETGYFDYVRKIRDYIKSQAVA